METVVTNAFHRTVDAPQEIASRLLSTVVASRSLCHALAALGLEDRVVSVHRTGPTGFDLVWRLPDNGRAHLRWTATLEPDGDGGSLLSVSVQVGASDPDARERVLVAWPLVGALVEQQTRRILTAIAARAEQLAEEDAFEEPARGRAAA